MHILPSGRYEMAFSFYPRCGTEEFAGERGDRSFLIPFDLYIFDLQSAAKREFIPFTEGRIRRCIEFAYSIVLFYTF